MAARRMFVRKELVTYDTEVLVNEWTGTLGRRAQVRGIEVWHFNDRGQVDNQRLYGFLHTGPETSVVQNLRMFAAAPVTAATYGWLRLRAGDANACR
jgi:hypothetical protein